MSWEGRGQQWSENGLGLLGMDVYFEMTDGIDFVPLVSGKSSSLNVSKPEFLAPKTSQQEYASPRPVAEALRYSQLVDCSFGLHETVTRCLA